MNTSLTYRTDVPVAQREQIDYIVLDSSGSMMGTIWWDAFASIDAYVKGLRDGHVNSHIKLVTFDSKELNYPHFEGNISTWTPLNEKPFGPFGGITPLYDAIACTGRELRDLNPPRASVVFVTDGDENGSTHTDLTQAKAIIKWMEAKGWSVTFIGCGFDNSKLANKLGVHEAQAIGVSQKLLGDAGASLAKKRVHNARTGAPMHWSDDERQQFGGYLGHG